MSESNRYQSRSRYAPREENRYSARGAGASKPRPAADPTTPSMSRLLSQFAGPFKRLVNTVDKAIPNPRTADSVADGLVRGTLPAVIMGIVLLIAGVIASRIDMGIEGFLWGIPSLFAVGVGVIFWIWSSNVVLRPDLSDRARAQLKRAIRLQWVMLVMGVLALVYFVGMALRLW